MPFADTDAHQAYRQPWRLLQSFIFWRTLEALPEQLSDLGPSEDTLKQIVSGAAWKASLDVEAMSKSDVLEQLALHAAEHPYPLEVDTPVFRAKLAAVLGEYRAPALLASRGRKPWLPRQIA